MVMVQPLPKPEQFPQFDLSDEDVNALYSEAVEVLELNSREQYIVPAHDGPYGEKSYLWDMCFAASAKAKYDLPGARKAFENHLALQHPNGKLPHIAVWAKGPQDFWVTDVNGSGYRHRRRTLDGRTIKTSNITQPALPAVAAVEIASNIPNGAERQAFASAAAKKIIKYHEWLYRERELFADGLVVTVHPHETGRDDAPSHRALLHAIDLNRAEQYFLDNYRSLFEQKRTDKDANPHERSDTDTVMRAAALATWQLRTMRARMTLHRSKQVPATHPYQHIDPGFNAILDRANDELMSLAEIGKVNVPLPLQKAMARTATGLQQLWDKEAKAFRGIDARGIVTFQPGQEIGDLLPIYSDHVTDEQVRAIIGQLQDGEQFGGDNLPSVNRLSPSYDSDRFWQGADWPQIRLLLIDGLYRKPDKMAHRIANNLGRSALSTAIRDHEFPEYRDADTGEAKGVRNFSWAAALVVELLILEGLLAPRGILDSRAS